METISRRVKSSNKISGLWKKLRGNEREAESDPFSVGTIDSARRITERDIYRYRKQRGVNLGSWFVLECWITDVPFQSATPPGQSDFDVASGSNARDILEKHWDTWITGEDWDWLVDHGINTVRIPIGFYHVCTLEPSVIDGTSFSRFMHVFEGAWPRILRAIEEAAKRGIGVLIDLHAAPGKQNADAHSGQTGSIRFFESKNMAKTEQVLTLLARTLDPMTNVVGLQLLNEPQNNGALEGWYQNTLNAIRKVAPSLPLYLGDAWDTNKFTTFVGQRRPEGDFAVVDHHVYRCFTSQDHQLSGDEHANVMRAHFSGELAARAGECHGNIVIGEWSAALNPASLRSGEAGEQDRQRRVFARAELEVFERNYAGWYFWTYKKDGWDAGWSLRDTVRAEIMPAWHGVRRNVIIVNDEDRKGEAKERAFEAHCGYWDRYGGSGKYEHWRFEEGFELGWDDAVAFFGFEMGHSVSEIGFKGQWAKRLLVSHKEEKGKSGSLWEFEHGVVQGIDAAAAALLRTT